MKNIHIREALKVGWSNFTKRPWYLLGLTLAVFLLFVFTSSQYAFATALAYILYGGYLMVLMRHYEGGRITFDDLFSIDSRWISFAFVGLIKGVLIFVGFLCFIIPGIYLSIYFMFAEFLVLDKGMKPAEALRASGALTKGHRWKLFFFSLVSLVLWILGFFVFIVGAVVALIVTTFGMIYLYKTLQESSSEVSL